jgi:(p)ppGpp synthase/HD superfamily hydrolase
MSNRSTADLKMNICRPVRYLLDLSNSSKRVVKYLGDEDANRRRVLLHTLAKATLLSWRVDPRIQLYGRIKSIASISDKMSKTDLGVHQILDIIGIRAITQRTRDCYRLVNRIHCEFEALEHEYDDYIEVPKPNGYRSIHTTVISLCGFPVEIQIRTQWMDTLAERGPAAHWGYKEDRAAGMPLPPLPHCSFTSGGVA